VDDNQRERSEVGAILSFSVMNHNETIVVLIISMDKLDIIDNIIPQKQNFLALSKNH
jgi:hypothetical protein